MLGGAVGQQPSLGPWRSGADLVGSGDAGDRQARTGGRMAADAAVHAMHDALSVAVYRLVDAFGEQLIKVVGECKGDPMRQRSTTDATWLLQSFLKGEQ